MVYSSFIVYSTAAVGSAPVGDGRTNLAAGNPLLLLKFDRRSARASSLAGKLRGSKTPLTFQNPSTQNPSVRGDGGEKERKGERGASAMTHL